MVWRGFSALAGQVRSKVSYNRAVAGLLSSITHEEEQELQFLKEELGELPKMSESARLVYGDLVNLTNKIQALSRFEAKKLQQSICATKIARKIAATAGRLMARGINGAQFQLKSNQEVRQEALLEARESVAGLKQLSIDSDLIASIRKKVASLFTGLTHVKSIQLKVEALLGKEEQQEIQVAKIESQQ